MSLIQISDLTFAYDGTYENIFDHASFQLDTNWRLGFTGRNGRGKTTFLNLLLGKYEYKGSISASVSFSYFPYDVADKSLFAIECVWYNLIEVFMNFSELIGNEKVKQNLIKILENKTIAHSYMFIGTKVKLER